MSVTQGELDARRLQLEAIKAVDRVVLRDSLLERFTLAIAPLDITPNSQPDSLPEQPGAAPAMAVPGPAAAEEDRPVTRAQLPTREKAREFVIKALKRQDTTDTEIARQSREKFGRYGLHQYTVSRMRRDLGLPTVSRVTKPPAPEGNGDEIKAAIQELALKGRSKREILDTVQERFGTGSVSVAKVGAIMRWMKKQGRIPKMSAKKATKKPAEPSDCPYRLPDRISNATYADMVECAIPGTTRLSRPACQKRQLERLLNKYGAEAKYAACQTCREWLSDKDVRGLYQALHKGFKYSRGGSDAS